MHIESPYRPDEPARRSRASPACSGLEEVPPGGARGGCRRRPAALAHAPGHRLRAWCQSLQTAATCTTIAEADMSRIEVARKAAKPQLPALPGAADDRDPARVPELNATLEGDQHTVYTDAVHLGIAVLLGEGGLIVPVIRDAQDLSVEGLAKRIKDIAARARSNQLKPDEVSGGTFTITNPGPYGSLMATPVINLPQVGDPRHRVRRQAARRRSPTSSATTRSRSAR